MSMQSMVRRTTFLPARSLARHLGIRLALVAETFQETGSFALRAADYVVSHVSSSILLTGSCGNFGRALAYATMRRGKSCLVALPSDSPGEQIEVLRKYQAQVEFFDAKSQMLSECLCRLKREYPGSYVITPEDDPLAIQGVASLGRELASFNWKFDTVVVPIGGGVLASGILQGLRDSGKKTFVVGAEPLAANDAARSFKIGKLVSNASLPQTIADGARHLRLGQSTWPILYRSLFDIVEVPEEKIVEAMRLLFNFANLKSEPTGALGLAALLSEPQLFRDRTVCCVVSGANVRPSVYQTILAA
jgi:threonine dehydratase